MTGAGFREWADPGELAGRLRRVEASGALDLPLPGGGRTADRFDALRSLGAADLSLGRLAEAHTDAVAIRAEAGLATPRGVLYGVWAAGGPSNLVTATRHGGSYRLDGTRHWCSGAGLLDRALLPVRAGDDELLVDVDLAARRVGIDASTWRTPVMAATVTATVHFDGVELRASDVVGGPGFYLDRPGFWMGSVGVAAVWAGGATAIGATVRRGVAAHDPHGLAHLGAVETGCWVIRAALGAAATEIDADPHAPYAVGMRRALRVRHVVERTATEVIDRAARALGPGPLVGDADHARRVAELQLYVRQTHADADLAELGRLDLEAPTACDGAPAGAQGRHDAR